MSHWESAGKSNDWYTPAYIFDALGCTFDTDVAAPEEGPRYVPTRRWICRDSLSKNWEGFVWMNPPFGGRNGLEPWLGKFFAHGNGIALTPDRTSAPWWQAAAKQADAILFVAGKIKFELPDGTFGDARPSNGTTLLASGPVAVKALVNAEVTGLGYAMSRTVGYLRTAA